MSTPMQRVENQAALAAGRRDGSSMQYRPFDEDEWTGDRAKDKPSELFIREEWHEMAPPPKALAEQLLGLIAHVREVADNLTDLTTALPVHDLAGKVIKAEIQSQIRDLLEGPESQGSST